MQRSPSPGSSHSAFRSLDARVAWLLLIVAAGFLAYLPVLDKADWVNWDDPTYLANSLVTGFPDNLADFWTTPVAGNYHPLTMLSLGANNWLAGESARGFALGNLLLHLANSALVFVFVFVLSDRKAMIAGLTAFFFAVHPMHVESVAWISERKDVLYTFFFLLALILHLRGSEENRRFDGVLAWLCFLLSLLSKPAAVALPLCLVVIDVYQRRPLVAGRIFYYAPFFLLAFLAGIVTLDTQHVGDVAVHQRNFGWLEQVLFAAYGFVFYIVKAAVPLHLSAFHPYPEIGSGGLPWQFVLAPFGVLAAGVAALISLRRRRIVFFGIAFYLATIVLVLKLIPVGSTLVAERYSYVPYIGLFWIGAHFANDVLHEGSGWRRRQRVPLVAALCVFGVVCMGLTARRTVVWTDSIALWSDVIEKYPGQVPFAHESRGQFRIHEFEVCVEEGDALCEREKLDAAIADFSAAIEIDGESLPAYIARGVLLRNRGDYALALADFNEVLSIDPGSVRAFTERGRLRLLTGNRAGASADFQRAQELESAVAAGLGTPRT